MKHHGVELLEGRLADFCRRWKISTLALFGSILGDQFTPDSDVDFLASFTPEADWSLLDHLRMEEELKAIVGREVDVVSRRAVERSGNQLRRTNILATAETVYVAR
jgi:hypothetical protein